MGQRTQGSFVDGWDFMGLRHGYRLWGWRWGQGRQQSRQERLGGPGAGIFILFIPFPLLPERGTETVPVCPEAPRGRELVSLAWL